MIYIQTEQGLNQVSASLTKEKIITALGYTPADNATFWEDQSGALVVVDTQGYVIARIDGEGIHTTNLSAATIQLNDEDLLQKIEDLGTIDLSAYYTKAEIDAALANLDLTDYYTKGEVDKALSEVNPASNLDLVNDHEDEFVISDIDGNVIMRIDANGLNTTNLYLNGVALNQNALTGKTLSILGDSISTYSGYLPDGYASYYPKGDVDSVNKTWWMQLINKNNMILGANVSHSGSPVQTDDLDGDPGLATDEMVAQVGANGVPDVIIIECGINDAKNEDFNNLGEISTNFELPLSHTFIDSLDTTTFLGAYQALISKLMLAYPNARIACWSVTYTSRGDNHTHDRLYKASCKIKELCDVYGCEFLEINKSGINPANMGTYLGCGDSNMTHPNAAGMTKIADYIGKCLK